MRQRFKVNLVASAAGNSVKGVKSLEVRHSQLKGFHEEFVRTHEVHNIELTDLQKFKLRLEQWKLDLDSRSRANRYEFPDDPELCKFEDGIRRLFNKN